MIRPTASVSEMSDADLRDTFAWIDSQIVKSGPNKGMIKMSAARLGDRILSEASSRGISL